MLGDVRSRLHGRQDDPSHDFAAHHLGCALDQVHGLDRLDNVGGRSAAPVAAQNPRRITLLVGPEGGFSDAERKKLEGKTLSWNLGGRVLRAETAVIVGLSAVQLSWGDFRPDPAIVS